MLFLKSLHIMTKRGLAAIGIGSLLLILTLYKFYLPYFRYGRPSLRDTLQGFWPLFIIIAGIVMCILGRDKKACDEHLLKYNPFPTDPHELAAREAGLARKYDKIPKHFREEYYRRNFSQRYEEEKGERRVLGLSAIEPYNQWQPKRWQMDMEEWLAAMPRPAQKPAPPPAAAPPPVATTPPIPHTSTYISNEEIETMAYQGVMKIGSHPGWEKRREQFFAQLRSNGKIALASEVENRINELLTKANTTREGI